MCLSIDHCRTGCLLYYRTVASCVSMAEGFRQLPYDVNASLCSSSLVWEISFVIILRKKKLPESPFSILVPAKLDWPRPMCGAMLAEQGDMGGDIVNGAGGGSSARGQESGQCGTSVSLLSGQSEWQWLQTVKRAVWEWFPGSWEQCSSGDRWQGFLSSEGQDFCDKSGEHRWKNT